MLKATQTKQRNEMPTVKGQVKALARSGKALMIEDKWYSERYGIKGVDRGDTISFEYKVNGDFNNISSKIEKISSGAAPAANSGGASGGRGNIDTNILASHSINCATQLAIHDGDTGVLNLETWVKIIYQLNMTTREKITGGELDKKEEEQESKPVDEDDNPFN